MNRLGGADNAFWLTESIAADKKALISNTAHGPRGGTTGGPEEVLYH